MSDVTYTEAWKKQEKAIQLVATNEQIRFLERTGYMKDGSIRLGALYLYLIEEVVSQINPSLSTLVEEFNEQAGRQQRMQWLLTCTAVATLILIIHWAGVL